MSDHAWVLQNIASYVAGGLDAAERERLERHAAECASCAQAWAEGRDLDHTLAALFADVRPKPELEDRMIQSLRQGRSRAVSRYPFRVRMGIGATAAAVLLAGVGTVVNNYLLPDEAGPRAHNNLNQLGLVFHSDYSGTMADRTTASKSASETGLLPPSPTDGTSNTVALHDAERLAEQVRSEIQAGDKTTISLGGQQGRISSPTKDSRLGGRDNLGHEKNEQWVNSYRLADQTKSAPPAENKPALMAGAGTPPTFSDKGANYYSYLNAQPGSSTPAGAAPVWSVPAPATGAASPSSTETDGKFARAAGASLGNGLGMAGFGLAPGEKGGEKKVPQRIEPQKSLKGEEAAWKDQKGGSPYKGKEERRAEGPAARQEPPAPAASTRKIIRSGEIEFEIVSFDEAVATISRLVGALKEGYVATVNSEKLPNGKVRGSVVVRVPPDRLDALLLDLRKDLGKTGELKGQRIGSQDITKQYTDLESRLRAARAMEERLLQIIKTGKGEIKDLLQAEKELGVWRTKIEEFEGELRYYANQVALSTLTITLVEKEIRAPSGVTETERVQMGLEVEDVEKAQRQALALVAEAKGRITRAELRQQGEGRYNAILHFEVAADAAGVVRDRLKQLGQVARLDVDRVRQADDGSGRPQTTKVERVDAQFQVSIYNLANVAPRETVHLSLAVTDAEAAYKTVLALVHKASGRVVSSNLNRQRNEQTKGIVQFEAKTADADALLMALRDVGEVMSLQVTENADAQGVTRSKRGFQVQLWALGTVPPRETISLQLATRDVLAAYHALQETVAKAKGRVLNAQLNEQDRQNITGQLDFEVRRDEEAAVRAALTAAGDVFARTVTRAQDSEQVIDSKLRWQVKLINASAMQPRETVVLGIEVRDVDQAAAALTAFVTEAKGRSEQAQVAHERNGQVTAKVVFDVPLAAAAGVVAKFKGVGTVRAQQSWRNLQVPESELAVARLEVTLSNTELIVPSDVGLWPQIRKGLHTSFVAISWSLTVVIIGLCFVLPWAIVLYAAYLVVRWLRRKTAPAPTNPPA
jgi:hypothetical protein